jgi:pimeloyl-ACP methyl ester carboxylesterase
MVSETTTWKDTSPHASRFVQANGTRLHVLDWGGPGEDLVLIGGSDGSPHQLDDLAASLSASFRVIVPARRGHGQSEELHEPFEVDVLAEDLRQLLDSLGVERASVLGHSFGGAEITRFAALHPNRVNKLIYLDAHYERVDSPWSDAAADRPDFPCFAGNITSLEPLRECMLLHLRPGLSWSSTMEAALTDMVQKDAEGFYRLKSQAPYARESRSAINTNYRREYESLEMPVLALFVERFFPITGTDTAWDRQTVEWHERYFARVKEWAERRFSEAIPHVRMETLPGTAHEELVHLDPDHRDPDRLAEVIRAFLLDRGTAQGRRSK